MTRRGQIPLAPRPLPGEAVLSWIARLAARYDLTVAELLACLRGGDGVYAMRLASLDWREDPELEHLLARAAGFDRSRIRALRPVVAGWPDPAAWCRHSFVWCPGCVQEDVARRGESYARAAWRLGCCVVCPVHNLLLVQDCPLCGGGRCRFQAAAGRQRLVCDVCRRTVDAWPQTSFSGGISDGRPNWFRLVADPDRSRLVLALQTALLTAFAGSIPALAARYAASARSFVAMTGDLAGVFLGAARRGRAAATDEAWIFARLDCDAAFELLGLVAAVLDSVPSSNRVATGTIDPATSDRRCGSIDLAWLTHRRSDAELVWLRDQSKGWGRHIARAVREAVGQEVSERRRMAAIRERERLDAAWLRQASIRYVAQAKQRTGAHPVRNTARRPLTALGGQGKRPVRAALHAAAGS